MKIKDLPKDKVLTNTKFKHPKTGETCVFKSAWAKGVWWIKLEDISKDSAQVYPLHLDDISDFLDFEVIVDD